LHAANKVLQNVAAVGVAAGEMANAAEGRQEKYYFFANVLF